MQTQSPSKLLATSWRFSAPSGRILSCGIYDTYDMDARVEVRVGYSRDDVLYSRRTIELGTAREIAAELRAQVLGKGGFTELPASTMTTRTATPLAARQALEREADPRWSRTR